MGLVFYFVATAGSELVNSKPIEKKGETLIFALEYNLDVFKEFDDSADKKLLRALIEAMTDVDPEKRPSADKVLANAYFWDKKRVLEFVHEIKSLSEEEHPSKGVVDNAYKNYVKPSLAYGPEQNWIPNFPKKKLLKFTGNLRGKKNESDDQRIERLRTEYGTCLKSLIGAIRNAVNLISISFDQKLIIFFNLGRTFAVFRRFWNDDSFQKSHGRFVV